MKRIGLWCALFLLGLAADAQKVHFVYVQSDNGAPFYVRLGEKVLSATGSGYVIVSGLRDSSYVLQVGFPGSTNEYRFPVDVRNEDKGFELKQVGGAWNLFDLQTLALTKALASLGPTEEQSREWLASADPFTRLLVQASDDLTLLGSGPSATPVAVESLPPAPMPAVPQPEVAPTVVATPAALRDTLPAEAPYRRSQVLLRSESSTTEGFGLVFIDNDGSASDTIRLLIPNPSFVPARSTTDSAAAPAAPVAVRSVVDTVLVVRAMPDVRDTMPAQHAEAPAAAEMPAVSHPSVPADTVKVVTTAPASAVCAAQAENKDFLKLRKNMAAAGDETEMLTVARKEFRKRCYTVGQIRLLGTLFLADLGRYQFFESAWGHVSDPSAFSQLQTELKDTYLIDRLTGLMRSSAQ